MNRFKTITIVSWQTSNRKHQKKAHEWSKDYGLEYCTSSLSIGELYKKERKQLQKKFEGLFKGTREKFYFFALCKSCFNSASLEKDTRHALITHPPFELVQISEHA